MFLLDFLRKWNFIFWCCIICMKIPIPEENGKLQQRKIESKLEWLNIWWSVPKWCVSFTILPVMFEWNKFQQTYRRVKYIQIVVTSIETPIKNLKDILYNFHWETVLFLGIVPILGKVDGGKQQTRLCYITKNWWYKILKIWLWEIHLIYLNSNSITLGWLFPTFNGRYFLKIFTTKLMVFIQIRILHFIHFW